MECEPGGGTRQVLQQSLWDPHLDFERFAETNSFLAAALQSVSRGYIHHPPGPAINGLVPAGQGAVSRLTSGAEGRQGSGLPPGN